MSTNDDYLWDRSGPPDPEVERLERLLGRFRHRPAKADRDGWQKIVPFIPFAAAASLLLALGAWWITRPSGPDFWQVAAMTGRPEIDAESVDSTAHFYAGDWLETDSMSRAQIYVGDIGQVEVFPGSRIRLINTDTTNHRLQLAHGMVHASIWALLRLFFVETPGAVAVDLGCAYQLMVKDSGNSYIHVTSGWVALESNGRESIVPTGGYCESRPGKGPGIPYCESVEPEFAHRLQYLNFVEPNPDTLATVLAEARACDALSLWHLLSRLETPARGQIYDQMAALTPPPIGITRDGILALEKPMLERWREQITAEGTCLYCTEDGGGEIRSDSES